MNCPHCKSVISLLKDDVPDGPCHNCGEQLIPEESGESSASLVRVIAQEGFLLAAGVVADRFLNGIWAIIAISPIIVLMLWTVAIAIRNWGRRVDYPASLSLNQPQRVEHPAQRS